MSQARPLSAAIQQEDRSGSERPWTERLTRVASAAAQRYWAGVALAAAAGATFFVHLPVLDHYFFGDDFVSLADISLRSTPGYIKDLLLLRDMTPNWRFLTGLYYLGAYRAFGLNAFPYFLTSVLLHTGTAMLIFWLVRRVVGGVWPAFLAAAFFGLSAAHVPTVGQVTAFNNVLAGFLTMLALVSLYEGLMRERLLWLLPASAVSFAAAIAANDSAAVLAPVFGLAVLWKVAETDGWWRQARQWLRAALLSAPYAVIGGAALLSFWACQCTQASRGGNWGAGDHMVGNALIYLGRLLYPIGMEAPGDVGPVHLAGGLLVAVLGMAALLRGPALARVSVAFLLLALAPYVPLHWALAPRYVYMAAIPFSILAALLFAEAARYGSRVTVVAPALLGVVALGVLGLHGWQSVEQNASFEAETDDWRALVSALEERFPDLAPGSKVYVRGGPLTDGIWQFHVLPSVGEVVWGGVVIAAVPEEEETFCDTPGGDVFVIDYDDGAFNPVLITVLTTAPSHGISVRPPPPPDAPRPAIVVQCPISTFPE